MRENVLLLRMLSTEDQARDFVRSLCDSEAFERLELLVARLKIENEKQNLVARSTLETVWQRHIADSAQLIGHVSRETGVWLDLGSGAGFPGLVIAAMRPMRKVVLVEARRLRFQWLAAMSGAVDVPNCSVIGRDLRHVETFEASVITARAFAPLDRLIEVSARFSTKSTEWVLPKGSSAAQEIALLPKHLRSRFHVKQSLTDPSARIVVAHGQLGAAA